MNTCIVKPNKGDYRQSGNSDTSFRIKQQKSSCVWSSVKNTMKFLSQAGGRSSLVSYLGIVWTAKWEGVPWQSHPQIVPSVKLLLENEIFPEEFAQLVCRKHLDHKHCNTSMLVGSNCNDLDWQTHERLNRSEKVCFYVKIPPPEWETTLLHLFPTGGCSEGLFHRICF